jgi:hypothetical protein
MLVLNLVKVENDALAAAFAVGVLVSGESCLLTLTPRYTARRRVPKQRCCSDPLPEAL